MNRQIYIACVCIYVYGLRDLTENRTETLQIFFAALTLAFFAVFVAAIGLGYSLILATANNFYLQVFFGFATVIVALFFAWSLSWETSENERQLCNHP